VAEESSPKKEANGLNRLLGAGFATQARKSFERFEIKLFHTESNEVVNELLRATLSEPNNLNKRLVRQELPIIGVMCDSFEERAIKRILEQNEAKRVVCNKISILRKVLSVQK
jgi:hypothetical protein